MHQANNGGKISRQYQKPVMGKSES